MRKPFNIAVGLVLTAAFAQGNVRQDSRPVTITLQAMRLEATLKKLSASTGLQLVASPQTAQDVVTVRWKDVPIDEGLKRLADAVDGSWRTEGQILRLIRTSDQQHLQDARERAYNTEEIRKSIAMRLEQSKAQPAWSPQVADALAIKVAAHLKRFNPNSQYSAWYQNSMNLSQEAPTGRVLTQILMTLDPVELATITTGISTVWSTNPTSMQRQMPPHVSNAIDQFAQAQADWNQALIRHSVQNPTFEGSTYAVSGFGELGHLEEGTPQVATALVKAQRVGELSGISVEFSAYDAKGKRIALSQAYLASEFMSVSDSTVKDTNTPSEPVILVPDEGALIAKRLEGFGRTGGSPLPPDLVARLSQCDVTDPLSWITSPCLVSAAEAKGLNMVACLSDMSMMTGMSDSTKKLRASQFLKRLEMFGHSVQAADGWLTVKPRRPVTTRLTRADRFEMKAYLQRLLQTSPMHLEELAEFALHLPDQQDNFMPSLMAVAINRSIRSFNDSNTLRFLALTTKDQRQRMQGDGLAIRSLSNEAQNCLAKMVFGGYSALQYSPPTTGNPRQGFNQGEYELYSNGILHEPTEALPIGFPDQAYVALHVDSSGVALADDSGARFTSISRAMTARDLAWQRYSQERPDLFPWASHPGQQLNLTNLQFGKQFTMRFEFRFTPVLTMTKSLEEQSLDGNSSGGIASFPEDFRKEYEKSYEEYRKAYANSKPGQFSAPPGQQNIPPY